TDIHPGFHGGTGPLVHPRRLYLQFLLESWRVNGGYESVSPGWWATEAPPAAPEEGATPAGTDDPELNREVELFPAKPVPRTASPPLLIGGPLGPEGMPTLGDLAEKIHRATGLEVIADSFVRGHIEPATVAGRQPLVKILDAVAKELDYRWQKEGHRIT